MLQKKRIFLFLADLVAHIHMTLMLYLIFGVVASMADSYFLHVGWIMHIS